MSKNRYQNKVFIGAGETGGVYEVLDSKLQRQVAMRRFFDKSNIGEVTENREEFSIAAQPLTELQHTNLLNVFDVGVDDEGAYVVSQHLAGRPLHEEVRKGAMAPYDVSEFAKQMLDVFSFLHDKGYCHGALNAGSIMMTPRARGGHRAILIDMGLARIAKLIKGGDGPLSVMADHVILAPELFDGAVPDERSDLYMLGQLFYMCLAGGHPYGGLEVDEVKKLQKEGLLSIRQYNSAVSEEFDDWLTTLTQADPAERPESAVDALNALPDIQPSNEVLSARVQQYTDRVMQVAAATSTTSAKPIKFNSGKIPLKPQSAPVPIMAPGRKEETSRVATTIPQAYQNVPGVQPQPQQVSPQVETSSQVIALSEKKNSSIGLFITLGAIVSIVSIVVVMGLLLTVANDEGANDEKGGEVSRLESIREQSQDSEVVEPIVGSGSSELAEIVAYFDGSSNEHPGWVKSSPNQQSLVPVLKRWLLSDKEVNYSTSVKHPIKTKLKKMFTEGWRITYRVQPFSGPHMIGLCVPADSNPGWGEGRVGFGLVLKMDKKRMVIYSFNGKDFTEGKSKKSEFRIRRGKKRWVNLVIEQNAESVSAEYVVKIDGKEVFKDVLLKDPQLENQAYWENSLFSSTLTTKHKGIWYIDKINLETL